MGKKVKIPGRLESAETGGIVTGANEIMDDTRGITQYVVNNNLEEAILQLGESKQNKLTFDQTPTEDSPNPVTSGGVYAADQVLSQAIEAILLMIPSAASALNKLVDMATMNSSIATATASFKGTYNLVSDLHLSVDATHAQIAAALDALSLDADNNDYAFVQVPNTDTAPTEIAKMERYKFNGENWAYEYDLNNSGFTSDQWAAINSGITTLLVSKLSALPTSAALASALAGKQDVLTFDNVPTAGSPNPVKSGGVYMRNNEIVALINALDAAKQDVLTFDTTPTSGSPNPVTSNGIYLAIQLVQTAVVALDGRMSTAETKISTAETNIVNLQAAYSALTQSGIVVVEGALPSSGQQQNIIYRQPDPDHTPPQFYSDYMWNGTAWVLMAQYDNAIDDVPTDGSDNLVKSGGLYNSEEGLQNAISNNIVSFTSVNPSSALNGYKISNAGSDKGQIVESSANDLSVYPCKSGDVFKIDFPAAYGVGNGLLYAIYNSSSFSPSTAVRYGKTIKGAANPEYAFIPDDGQFIVIDTRLGGYVNTVSQAEPLTDDVLFYVDAVEESVIEGKKIGSDGSLTDDANYTLKAFNCQGIGKYMVIYPSEYGATGTRLYAVYNSSTFDSAHCIDVSAASMSGKTDPDIINIPNGGQYVVICSRVTNKPNVIQNSSTPAKQIPVSEESSKDMVLNYNISNYGGLYIKVNYKYSGNKDIQVVLAPFGPNSLIQLHSWGFIENVYPVVSKNDPSNYIVGGSDWVCPYVIEATDVSTGATGGGWTGGNHGVNPDGTGAPTARSKSLKIYADGKLLTSYSILRANEIRVVVTNEVMANNTVPNIEQGTAAIYCLEEEITYLFKDGKIYVSALVKALQNIDLEVYYGMGCNQFASEVIYFGENIAKYSFEQNSQFDERCNMFACKNTNDEYVIMTLDEVGLARRTPQFFAHAYTYGKAYFNFIRGNETPIHYDANDLFFWSGGIKFSEKLEIV